MTASCRVLADGVSHRRLPETRIMWLRVRGEVGNSHPSAIAGEVVSGVDWLVLHAYDKNVLERSGYGVYEASDDG